MHSFFTFLLARKNHKPYVPVPMKDGEMIRRWRKSHGLTHEHVAAELRVHRNTVANWEEDAGSPKPKQLKLLEKRWPGLLRRMGLVPRTEAT